VLSQPAPTVTVVTELERLPVPAGVPPGPVAGGGAVSPLTGARPIRVSVDVLDADDPAAALAGRWLLRHAKGTRAVYRADLAEWFDFCHQLGVAPLVATLDHADAYGRYLSEALRRSGRPLAAATVQRKLGRLYDLRSS
jgi:hypothetical protein